MLCDSVGIDPRPNNGSLRLPLRPVGLHDPADVDPNGQLTDPEPTPAPAAAPPGVVSLSPIENPNPGPDPAARPTPGVPVGVDPVSGPEQGEAQLPGGGDDDHDDGAGGNGSGGGSLLHSIQDAWDWLTGQIEDAWGKITGSRRNR